MRLVRRRVFLCRCRDCGPRAVATSVGSEPAPEVCAKRAPVTSAAPRGCADRRAAMQELRARRRGRVTHQGFGAPAGQRKVGLSGRHIWAKEPRPTEERRTTPTAQDGHARTDASLDAGA